MRERISLAWSALRGNTPVREVRKDVEVAVVGEPYRATLYRAGVNCGNSYNDGFITYTYFSYASESSQPEYDYYPTCEQAHEAAKGGYVSKVNVIRIGNKYFIADRLQEVKVGPKPKRAKGKR